MRASPAAAGTDGVVAGKVAIFCFSSSGELDVVLPLLRIGNVLDYTLAPFKKDVLRKIEHDGFYRRIVEGHVEDWVIAQQSSSKAVRWLQFIGNALAAFRRFRGYDQFLFEFGNSGREKNVLILLLVLSGRGSKILFYPHGHALTAEDAYAPRRFSPIVRFATRHGARILKLDGSAADSRFLVARYPILRPEWTEFVRQHAPQLYHDHVVILSRDIHPQYLLEANRARMLSDTVAILDRYFPGSRIVLRAHPREFFDSDEIAIAGRTVEVTYENTYSVVRGAKLAVSFWTSAFFQCLALGVPVVEYHIPHERFRFHYPNGSLNAAFIPCCLTREALAGCVETLRGRDQASAT